MTIFKILLVSLLFVYETFAYTNNIKLNKKQEFPRKHITNVNLNRGNFLSLFSVIPFIPIKYIIKPAFAEVTKEKTIEELRKEALNIIDIIEVQKNTITPTEK